MILRNFEIKNFRGIKSCNLAFSLDARIVCLIGAGDNTKFTLLTAIEWIVDSAWNLQACDTDFYNCDMNEPIVLRGTFAEILGKLLQEDKFGLYIRKPNVEFSKNQTDTDTFIFRPLINDF